jgi:rfaE bifunctional protein kinase chain/domain
LTANRDRASLGHAPSEFPASYYGPILMSEPSSSSPARDLRAIVEGFAGRRILIWGDFVADRFLHGSTTRVSREAPALVLRYEGEEFRPGGAGNAALNAAALGASVIARGCVGDDPAGTALAEALQTAGIDIEHLERRTDGATPVKTRIMAGGHHTVHQQILRIDADSPWPERDSEAGDDAIAELARAAEGVMISDYGLGTVSPDAAARWLQARGDAPVVLDSRHRLLEFGGVTAATPNEEEAEEALGTRFHDDLTAVDAAGEEICRRLGCSELLVTRGSDGMAVFSGGKPAEHLAIHGSSEIADVTGAGDTVLAAFTLSLVAGASTLDAARIANAAAGLAVLKHGTATVSRDELLRALRDPA